MPAKFEFVPLENLKFDPLNPRLPSRVNGNDVDDVLKFMVEDAGLLDLMGSIAKQGFFPGEPLLVTPDPKDGSDYIVIEGNRRLASCYLLNNPQAAPRKRGPVSKAADGMAPGTLDTIPVLIFPARNDILKHLGYRHVTGIKEWDPLAKARFLRQQFNSEAGTNGERFKSIAKSIGSRSDYVGRLLTAFHLYSEIEEQNFYDIPDLDETTLEFSLISSFLAYTDIVEYLQLQNSQDLEAKGLNAERLKFITDFVFRKVDGKSTKLGESRNLKNLAAVLSNDKARDELEGGASLAVASRMVESASAAVTGLLDDALDILKTILRKVEASPFSKKHGESISEIEELLSQLREKVDQKNPTD